jgi:hypothetical protein
MKKIIQWKNKTAKKQHLQTLIEDDKQEATTYNKNDNHDVGDYIEHFKFGFGFIQNIISPTKIDVFFENSERVLLQNWK